MNGGKKTRGRTYWCPYGCGKTIEFKYDYVTKDRGHYCKKCKRLIARTQNELKKIV